MADVKVLHRDTAREEYFYRMGFQDGFKTARGDDATQRQLDATTKNALAQVE